MNSLYAIVLVLFMENGSVHAKRLETDVPLMNSYSCMREGLLLAPTVFEPMVKQGQKVIDMRVLCPPVHRVDRTINKYNQQNL